MSHGKGDIISAIKEHIDIPDYLESCGYHVRKHGSKGKLTLKEHDSFVYSAGTYPGSRSQTMATRD